jgi:hypothetical protein
MVEQVPAHIVSETGVSGSQPVSSLVGASMTVMTVPFVVLMDGRDRALPLTCQPAVYLTARRRRGAASPFLPMTNADTR